MIFGAHDGLGDLGPISREILLAVIIAASSGSSALAGALDGEIPSPGTDALLLESGTPNALLLESGTPNNLLLESAA